MTSNTLKNLAVTFAIFASEHSNDKYLFESIQQIYHALHDILCSIGYHVFTRDTFNELYAIHMEYNEHQQPNNERILNFAMQLTHMEITDNASSQYDILCDSPAQIYELLYKNPDLMLNHNTVVCKKSNILPLFLENKILIKKF